MRLETSLSRKYGQWSLGLAPRNQIAEMREMQLAQTAMAKHLIEQQDLIKSLMLTNDSMETTIEQIRQQLKEYLGIQ